MRAFLSIVFCLASAVPALGAGIEGASERYRFEPGDRVLYQTDLDRCPVGELLPEWGVSRGAYECARFRDRIWIRPLEASTVLYLRLPQPLPEAFSLEFPVWIAEDGCPFVEFRLHHAARMRQFDTNPNAYVDGAFLGGHLACHREPSAFGVRNTPGRLSFELSTRTRKDRIHRISVQVRRGQVRFFVDGKRIGHRPFRPKEAITGLSLYFHKHYQTKAPYADAPVLVGDLRIAAYSTPEPAPQVERDLIRCTRKTITICARIWQTAATSCPKPRVPCSTPSMVRSYARSRRQKLP